MRRAQAVLLSEGCSDSVHRGDGDDEKMILYGIDRGNTNGQATHNELGDGGMRQVDTRRLSRCDKIERVHV